MPKYIDADAFEVFGYTSQDGTFDDGVQFVLEKLDEQPTADVVEVVRCKDCKYGERKDYMPAKYCNLRYCKNSLNYHDKDFYCAMGGEER